MQTITYIYTLTDPETNKVRYVGKTNNINQRYKAHLNRARKNQIHKKNWIETLKKKGLKPIIEVIDIVPIENWIFWETYWIAQFRTWGFDLINYTLGGDGCTFANQTSFKKGNKSWNEGTAFKKVCIICQEEFKVSPYFKDIRKCCSHKCGAIHKSNQRNNGNFKNNVIPWNKGISYKLGERKNKNK